ncbi:uncharacterized protein [Epargyreus clarus]|uniref:uncharacterized protein n=1 Tax=Epargyreus clarus TaxID=520877 RepID=UPI003C2EB4CA
MRVFMVILVVTGLASSVVEGRQIQDHAWREQDIPERCAALSVTPVSCARPAPHSLLPHPDDCQLFYYCVDGAAEPVCRQCPAQLHFNPHLLVCDNPEVAGCVARVPIIP